MKNKLLFATLMIIGALTAKAQILNADFENWAVRTNYLNLTLTSPATLDTTVTSDPVDWTTSNEVTNGRIFHNKVLVTQSANAHSGLSSLRLRSDSVTGTLSGVPLAGTLQLNFVCPGFAVNGNFPINLSALASVGGSFNPALLPGAGVPVNGRKAKIGGFIKYAPAGGDTAYIVAVLRQGGTIVAEAKYLHSSTDAGFVRFEAPFTYYNCLEPDTLVYTLSSGNPYGISGVVLGGATGLHIGSDLSIDSTYLVDTILGFALPPTVLDDSAHTLSATPVTIKVSVNDNNCYGGTQTVTVSTQPLHGTAVASGDSIVYTPTAGWAGLDTFYYTASVPGSSQSSPGRGTVRVSPQVGIVDITAGQTSIYPNPTSSKLHITTTGNNISTVAIYDMLGSLVKTHAINSSLTVDVSSFNEGIYIIRFAGAEGRVVSSSRFSVVK